MMKKVYRILALLIAVGVALQAAAVAFGMFALIKWIEKGGTLDQSTELTPELGGYYGFNTHATVGIMIMPVLALLFLVSSFFAKVPGGIKWALIVFGVTVVQVFLGFAAHGVAGVGWLHGANALILFGVAVTAAMRVRTATAVGARAAETVNVA